jgi:multisubunit Na+/H+ antiporter MnhB subunit
MRHHFRLVAILVVCLAAYAALLVAFHWLSAPRDLAVLGGVALIVALLLIVPVVVRTTWRKL